MFGSLVARPVVMTLVNDPSRPYISLLLPCLGETLSEHCSTVLVRGRWLLKTREESMAGLDVTVLKAKVIFGVMKVVGSCVGEFYFAASECSFWLSDRDYLGLFIVGP